MKWSIRKWRVSAAACAFGLLVGTGCQVAQPQAPDRNNPTPIPTDAAMRNRDWPQSVALYPNFSSNTGPSEMLLVVDDRVPQPFHAALELPVFLADLGLMPVAMVKNPPWTVVEGSSLYLLPTYTANPPTNPAGGLDFSGGPGTGYNPAPGRAVVSHVDTENPEGN